MLAASTAAAAAVVGMLVDVVPGYEVPVGSASCFVPFQLGHG